ncbi:cyclin-H-like [Homalodisca vitripennis]|uniref:cyclin-H-like n=1 Tax=Homalodisca vitripennis TaxID=197043 RepID=UPI001EECE361|nr:cyclin-H-like [Homalodisca vitripennis]
MFSNNTQNKYLIFSNKEKITRNREKANKRYIESAASYEKCVKDCFLNAEEELMIVKCYENCLKQFFVHFNPKNEPVPKEVKGTAFHFYKRFFIVSSVMDYHPSEIMLTCIYLACKICDYAVSIDMFVRSIGGDPRLMKFIILDQEIEVLYRLGFRLHISLPHRCIEEYMTQIRDQANLEKPEKLYYPINRFLGSMWFTDICLLYSPTLIALAAVMQGVSRCRENIDHFVNHNLLGCLPENKRKDVLLIVRDIRSTVIKSGSPPKIEEIAELEKKLAICRNPMNNPTSNVFKQRMMEGFAMESNGK